MATIERPNRAALQQALDIFRDAMRPFIVRTLKTARGAQVEDLIADALSHTQELQFRQNLSNLENDVQSAIDIGYFPQIVTRNWETFGRRLGQDRSVGDALWLIADARHQAAHPGRQDLDTDYAITRLSLIGEVLGRINAPAQQQAVEEIRDARRAATSPSQPATGPATGRPQPKARARRPSGALKPWREIIRPNQDVAQGTFQQAAFAANLQQVYDGRASATEYGIPVKFFNRTYITPGLRTLLVNTLKRLAGTGGDPVIQTKTGFGGGKTHSLIALYHLVKDTSSLTNASATGESARASAEVRDLMQEAGLDPDGAQQTKVAVLVGTHLATTDPDVTAEAGDPLNTLWGQMAHQLGGQAAYNIVGQAARTGAAPGGAQLDRLFAHVGPCVVLIDELVAYVRNAGAARDSIYTFVQALTESVSRSSRAALVVTLPESDVEAGGDAGREALATLDRLLGRIEAVWKPLETDEAFEVVRRRLFGEVGDEAARDRTCEAFAAMYGRSRSDYPHEAGEQRYLERLKACYPIHPEIFERLYTNWSSIPQFQRTRGVLRMLATAVSRLYLENDHRPLILPASLPLSDPALGDEFVKLLSEQWRPVLSEVDSDGSRTDVIDRGLQRFAEVGGAARRIARTVFLGSAPSGAVRGLDEREIRLGVVQPGQGVSVYNEALSRMSGGLYYLYPADGRYYFHAEENLNKVAADRREQLDTRTVNAHIAGQLQEAGGRRADVIVCPRDSADVPEAERVRLVILPPDAARPTRASEHDRAAELALDILKHRGEAGRVHRNTLLFLAARSDELRDLRNKVGEYLAWESIVTGETKIETLSGLRRAQAHDNLRSAERAVRNALVRAYRQALAPVQDDPQRADYRLSAAETNARDSGDIAEAAFRRFIDDEALVETISPTALASLLQQYVWDKSDHIGVDALWKLLISHVYMHRLRTGGVLQQAIRQGVPEGKFGFARGYQAGDYRNLRFREPTDDPALGGLAESGPGLLVSPEMAQLVKDVLPPPKVEPTPQPPDPDPGPGPDPLPGPDPQPRPPRGPRRIVAAKTIQDDISLDDLDRLSDEIIQNLRAAGGRVTIQVTVTAEHADGFPESTTRAVRENSALLGLDYSQPPD